MTDQIVSPPIPEGNIYIRLAAIAAEVGAMAKQRNTSQGFDAFAVDDVYSKLRPLFARYGVVVVPQVVDTRYEHITSKSGTQGIAAYVTMKYRLYAADGSHVTIRFAAEGQDYGDKATNKAVQQAFKYALIQMFMISTGEVDPDLEKPEERADPPMTAQELIQEPELSPAEKRMKAVKDAAWHATDPTMDTDHRIKEAKLLVEQAVSWNGGDPKNKTEVDAIVEYMTDAMAGGGE